MDLRRQPLLGIIATVLVIVVSLAFISVLDWPMFRDWVSYYLMCAIPFTFVVGAFWHGEHPRKLARLPQPWRGLGLLVLALGVALVVSAVLLLTVGHGVTPPTPLVTQCVIISVPISFCLAVVFGGWPFTLIRHPLLGGFALLVVTYAIAILVFATCMNFAFLQGAPFYTPGLDPQGPFDAWTVLVLIVTAMAAAFLLLHLELWPVRLRPTLMRQPVLGLVWTGSSLLIAAVVVHICLNVIGIAAPDYLVTVPVPFLFGSIVLLIILEGPHTGGLRQPLRGIVSAASAAVVGVALARLFVAVSSTVSGDLPWGAPSFDGEIWLASALLAVTFPFLSFHADFFGMWPLRPKAPTAVETTSVQAR